MPTRHSMSRLFSFSCTTAEGVRVSLLRNEEATVTKVSDHQTMLVPPDQITYDDMLVAVPDGDTRPRKCSVVEIAVHGSDGWKLIPKEPKLQLRLKFQDASTETFEGKLTDLVHVYDLSQNAATPKPLRDVRKGCVVWHPGKQRYGQVVRVTTSEKKLASA